MRQQRKRSAVSLAAHKRRVQAAKLLGVGFRRQDHPSVKRLLEAAKSAYRRGTDIDNRRLIDLWNETKPKDLGLLASFDEGGHRCAKLGQVTIAPDFHREVIVCRHHRNTIPSRVYGRGVVVGADWLRENMPQLYEEWKRLWYSPSAVIDSYHARVRRDNHRAMRGKRQVRQVPYSRVRPYIIVPQDTHQ